MSCICIFTKKIVHRLSFEEFLSRYQLLLLKSEDKLSPKASCKAIISQEFGWDDKENLLPCQRSIKVGKHKLFLKEKHLEKLEKDKRQLIDAKASCIQRTWRQYKQRQHRRLRLWAAVVIQAGFRGWKARVEIQEMHEAAKVIQHALLVYCNRREQKRLEEQEKLTKDKQLLMDTKALCIQRTWRQYKQRQHRRLRLQAIVIIQAGFRGWKARMEIQEMHEAAKVIQHALLVYCNRREQERLEERNDQTENTDDDTMGDTETDVPVNISPPPPYKFPMFPPSLFNMPTIDISTPHDDDITVNIDDEIDGITDGEDETKKPGLDQSDIGENLQEGGISSENKSTEDEFDNIGATQEGQSFQSDSSNYDIVKNKMAKVAMGIAIAGLLWNGPITI